MARYDIRQDKSYRRGLVLGLTMAEIMILLIFVLLMALANALAKRERQIEVLDTGNAIRLIQAIQAAYPRARNAEDYYKELRRAIDARTMVDSVGPSATRQRMLEDAELGSLARKAAERVEVSNPIDFARKAIVAAETRTLSDSVDLSPSRQRLLEDAELGSLARKEAERAHVANPVDFVRKAIGQAGPDTTKKGQWPPFFSLSEAGGYYFESGKATLRPDFVARLHTVIIPLLKKYIDDYGIQVVEVTGHTDEVPMVGKTNLDSLLIEASANRVPIDSLRSSDNAGLAIARAVSVVRILRADPRLAGTTILPLSGAQLIVPVDRAADGTATQSDQTRRRIEIRLRRSTEQVRPVVR